MASILFDSAGLHVKRNAFISKTATFTEFYKESVIILFASPFPYKVKLIQTGMQAAPCSACVS